MKKLLLLLFVLPVFSCSQNEETVFSQTQTPYLEWEQTYGGSSNDYLYSIIQTSNGGYLLGGETTSNDGDVQSGNHGDSDYWVVKIDANGTVEWERTYGGTSSERVNTIISTFDGGYILGGITFSNDGDVQSGNHGGWDFWIVKIDSNGTIEWEQTYGGSNRTDYLKSIIQTSDGGYILGGVTASNDGDVQSGNQGGVDSWIVKIDSSGIIEWEQTYGGSKWEYLSSIILTSDGGYLLGGETGSQDIGFQFGNCWIVKIDSSGIIEWEQTYGGSKWEYLSSIIPTSDGGYLLGGGTESNDGDVQSGNHGNEDYWVVKIDSSGIIEWEQTYGGTDQEHLFFTIPASDGGYLLGGGTKSNDGDVQSGNHGDSDYWIVKIDSTGTIEWEQTYGGSDWEWLQSAIHTSGGGYLLGGYTFSDNGDIQSGNHGKVDYWVVKINLKDSY